MSQTRNVDLRKEVFNKPQYKQVIDTSFSQLGVTSVSASAEDQISVEEFFGLYNSLFYDIPPTGDTNSHEFLVKESGQYINFDQIAEEILALQQEIDGLRKDLLAEQIKSVELETGVSFTGSIDLGTNSSIPDSPGGNANLSTSNNNGSSNNSY